MNINFQSIILELNNKERLSEYCGYMYVTDGYERIIEYAGITIFSTEINSSEEYCDLTEEQFIKYIIKLTKDSIKYIQQSI